MNIWLRALSEESEIEKELKEQIHKEIEAFENTPEYKAYEAKLHDLYHKQSEAMHTRMEKFKEEHPVMKRERNKERTEEDLASMRERNLVKYKEWEDKLPQNIKDTANAVLNMSKEEKYAFNKILSHNSSHNYDKLDNYENPITTKGDISQLQDVLVQTIISFIKEKGLTDIWSVSFGVDGLYNSVDYGQWCPDTDSSISVEGIQDGVRRFIGSQI